VENHELAEICRQIKMRQEPGGKFVAFNVSAARYVFVNRAAAALFEEIRAGRSVDEHCAALAAATGTQQSLVAEHLEHFARVLAGAEAPSSDPPQDDELPRAWSLAAEIGASAERCETFGMPL
jgi:hypothetical protein